MYGGEAWEGGVVAPRVDRDGREPDAADRADDGARERFFQQAGKLVRVDLDPSRPGADPHSNPPETVVLQHLLRQFNRPEEFGRHRLAMRDPGSEASVGRLIPVRKPAASGFGTYLGLSPSGPQERMAKTCLVHRPKPGTVVGEVIPLDAVEVLTDRASGPEFTERGRFDGPAEIATVGPVLPILRSGERVDRKKHVLNADGRRDLSCPSGLTEGYCGPGKGDRESLAPERGMGERRHQRGVDASGERDDRSPSFEYASFELLDGSKRRSGRD